MKAVEDFTNDEKIAFRSAVGAETAGAASAAQAASQPVNANLTAYANAANAAARRTLIGAGTVETAADVLNRLQGAEADPDRIGAEYLPDALILDAASSNPNGGMSVANGDYGPLTLIWNGLTYSDGDFDVSVELLQPEGWVWRIKNSDLSVIGYASYTPDITSLVAGDWTMEVGTAPTSIDSDRSVGAFVGQACRLGDGPDDYKWFHWNGYTWDYDAEQVKLAANKLAGRGSGQGDGPLQEITLGTNLSLSGKTLNAAGGTMDQAAIQTAIADKPAFRTNIGAMADTNAAVNTAIAGNPGATRAAAKAEFSGITFYEDFQRYANGTTMPNDQTFVPIIGNPWRINHTGAGATPIVTGGAFGAIDSKLWYIGSVAPSPGKKFSFGCVIGAFPSSNPGAVGNWSLNMSLSGKQMLTYPAMGINPSSVLHINMDLVSVTAIDYFQTSFTSDGAADIIVITGHNMATGDKLLFSGASLPSGITSTMYAIVLSDNTFKVASSYANAMAGTAVDIGTLASPTNLATCSINDIVCVNRPTTAAFQNFKPPYNAADFTYGRKAGFLVEVDGEFITVTRAGFGSIVYRSPSLPRMMREDTHFWYESKGGDSDGTGNYYANIYQAWANAPSLDRKHIWALNYPSNELVGGESATSKLNIMGTSGVSASGSEVTVGYGTRGATRAMTVDHAGNVALGNSAPYNQTNYPPFQIFNIAQKGNMVLTNNVGNSWGERNGSVVFNHADRNSFGTFMGISGTSGYTTLDNGRPVVVDRAAQGFNRIDIGWNNVFSLSATDINFYTASHPSDNNAHYTQTTGTRRMRINRVGAVTIETVGQTLAVKSGTNALSGTTSALVAGEATIASTAIDADTVIMLTLKTLGGTIGGQPYVNSITPGVGFTITGGGASNTSTYNWVALKTLAP
jgi:hypothetical protein